MRTFTARLLRSSFRPVTEYISTFFSGGRVPALGWAAVNGITNRHAPIRRPIGRPSTAVPEVLGAQAARTPPGSAYPAKKNDDTCEMATVDLYF